MIDWSWWVQMGMITLLSTMLVARVSGPQDIDWSTMDDPRSTQFQQKVFMAIFFTIVFWPLAMIGLIGLVLDVKRK